MLLSKEQIRRIEKEVDVDSSRKRAASRVRLWPNGVVIYTVDSSLSEYLVSNKLVSNVFFKYMVVTRFEYKIWKTNKKNKKFDEG